MQFGDRGRDQRALRNAKEEQKVDEIGLPCDLGAATRQREHERDRAEHDHRTGNGRHRRACHRLDQLRLHRAALATRTLKLSAHRRLLDTFTNDFFRTRLLQHRLDARRFRLVTSNSGNSESILAVHVAKITNTVKGVTYTSYYLRRSFRLDGKVKHETLGNLSDLPVHVIDLISRSLKGEAFVPASEAFRTLRSLPHGHVEAILTMIRRLGLDDLIASRPSRQRDLVLAMIAERLLFPCSKLATTRNWHDTTLAEELHVEDATEDELYAAMDWLLQRQKAIETKLAKRHLTNGCLVLYDVTSSYYEGETCPLARYGHDRDGKTGRPIIVYGVLTDAEGCPVAVQVYPGNTGDPSTVPDQVAKLSHQFGLSRVVLVGDRGMLTQTQINTLKKHPGLSWISALRSDAIRDLLRDGHLNRSLFDEVNLAEIESPDFPGERLIACYNPLLAEKRRRKREQLLAATEEILAKLARAVSLRTKKPLSAAEIGVKAGRVIGRHKMAKHIRLTIHDGSLHVVA